MKIEKITQIKKSDKYEVEFDNLTILILKDEILFKYALNKESVLTDEKAKEIIFENEKLIALEKAFNLLSKTFKTQKEMFFYLKNKNFSVESINFVLEKLKSYNYIDDLSYAKNYVEEKSKVYGKRLMRQKLFQKGISKEIIDQVLQIEQTDIVKNICEKFMKNKEKNQQNKQKLYRFLLSRGFSYDECSTAVGNYFSGDYDDWY